MIEALYILILTSAACGILGVFLLVRNLTMITDAISHTIFLGIVLAYFVVHDLGSPLLLVGAAVFGLLTVYLIELLVKSKLVKGDSATGIVFPFLFSIGVMLMTKYAGNVCLHVDTVLMGDVLLSTLKRGNFFGLDLPVSLINTLVMLLINVAFVAIFFKELKALSFDEGFAALSGFSVPFLHYALMSLVSLTCVVSFEAVGAILVIGLFVIPAAQAYLLTKKLTSTLAMTLVFGTVNACAGYFASIYFNVSMAGMVAAVSGLSFLLVMLVSADGAINRLIKRRRQKKEFAASLLIFHVHNHMMKNDALNELSLDTIYRHINWSRLKTRRHCHRLKARGLLELDCTGQMYQLTPAGLRASERLKREYGIR